MTPGHYIDGFERSFTDCPWRDTHIACDFLNASDAYVWMRAGALSRAPANRDGALLCISTAAFALRMHAEASQLALRCKHMHATGCHTCSCGASTPGL